MQKPTQAANVFALAAGVHEREPLCGFFYRLTLVQFVVKGLQADTEFFCSSWLVALMPRNCFLYGESLHLLETQRPSGARPQRCLDIFTKATIKEVFWQMLWQQWRVFAKNRCMLDNIRQLANVSRPWMLLENSNGLF